MYCSGDGDGGQGKSRGMYIMMIAILRDFRSRWSRSFKFDHLRGLKLSYTLH